MIAGLPATAWALMLVSVALGLSIELVFFVGYRRRRRLPAAPAGSTARADEPAAESRRPSAPRTPE